MRLTFLDDRIVVDQIDTDGLGDHSYIVSADGVAVIIDPQRDVARFENPLEAAGLHLEAVFETHIHNDYLSGGAILAGRSETRYVLPANTGATIHHIPASDGDEFTVGDFVLRALHTPGHTYDHVSYALVVDGHPLAIFSGGSMLVGAVGRSDLLGRDHTDVLLSSQYASVRRIANDMADGTVVAPTHGSGSFCAGSASTGSVSDIAQEKLSNPVLIAADLATFKRSQLAGYRLYPNYYRTMAPLNRIGVPPVDDSPIRVLDAYDRSGRIVDTRAAGLFAACHIVGSTNIPMSSDVGTYIGWIFENDEAYILIATQEDAESVRLQLQRIGYEHLLGRIDPSSVTDELSDVATYPTATYTEMLDAPESTKLDVRDPIEVTDGPVDGATNIHVAALVSQLADIPPGDVWVFCASGYRASIGASLLAAAGMRPVLIIDGYPE